MQKLYLLKQIFLTNHAKTFMLLKLKSFYMCIQYFIDTESYNELTSISSTLTMYMYVVQFCRSTLWSNALFMKYILVEMLD